jgi:hypothetical protein
MLVLLLLLRTIADDASGDEGAAGTAAGGAVDEEWVGAAVERALTCARAFETLAQIVRTQQRRTTVSGACSRGGVGAGQSGSWVGHTQQLWQPLPLRLPPHPTPPHPTPPHPTPPHPDRRCHVHTRKLPPRRLPAHTPCGTAPHAPPQVLAQALKSTVLFLDTLFKGLGFWAKRFDQHGAAFTDIIKAIQVRTWVGGWVIGGWWVGCYN